jgi:hypothetical protein
MRIGWLCGVMLLAGLSAARSEVTVKQVTFEGWEGAYQLSNGTVEVVFVPQIGRIMRYGFVGGPNALWVNPTMKGKTTDLSRPVTEWNNYGGDKVWPSPQSRWSWPPDPTYESAPYTVMELPNRHLLVKSAVSQKHSLYFTREIALEAKGTGVSIINTMHSASDKSLTWGVWEVAQTDSPDVARLMLNKEGKFATGYYVFSGSAPAPDATRIEGDQVLFKRHATQSGKIGSDSPTGRLAADKAGQRFEVSAAFETGKNYPDDGCAQEIWSNPDPDTYMELELLSPIQTLAPGKSYAFKTRWRLSRIK